MRRQAYQRSLTAEKLISIWLNTLERRMASPTLETTGTGLTEYGWDGSQSFNIQCPSQHLIACIFFDHLFISHRVSPQAKRILIKVNDGKRPIHEVRGPLLQATQWAHDSLFGLGDDNHGRYGASNQLPNLNLHYKNMALWVRVVEHFKIKQPLKYVLNKSEQETSGAARAFNGLLGYNQIKNGGDKYGAIIRKVDIERADFDWDDYEGRGSGGDLLFTLNEAVDMKLRLNVDYRKLPAGSVPTIEWGYSEFDDLLEGK
jgi:hypothetical protein